jgi:hypothetical protein
MEVIFTKHFEKQLDDSVRNKSLIEQISKVVR